MAHQHKKPTACGWLFVLLNNADSNPRVIATTNNNKECKLQLRSHNSSRYHPILLSHSIMRELRVQSPRYHAVGFLCCCPRRTQNPLCFAKRNTIELALPLNNIHTPHYARASGSESPVFKQQHGLHSRLSRVFLTGT